MLWPIGQPPGNLHRLALRSLDHWHTILRESGLWHDRCGSLHLAYRDDEAAVLHEFASGRPGTWLQLRDSRPTNKSANAPRWSDRDGLIAGLWSPTETCVDPREVVARLAGWLAERFGVRFEFGRAVVGYDHPKLLAGGHDLAGRPPPRLLRRRPGHPLPGSPRLAGHRPLQAPDDAHRTPGCPPSDRTDARCGPDAPPLPLICPLPVSGSPPRADHRGVARRSTASESTSWPRRTAAARWSWATRTSTARRSSPSTSPRLKT